MRLMDLYLFSFESYGMDKRRAPGLRYPAQSLLAKEQFWKDQGQGGQPSPRVAEPNDREAE